MAKAATGSLIALTVAVILAQGALNFVVVGSQGRQSLPEVVESPAHNAAHLQSPADAAPSASGLSLLGFGAAFGVAIAAVRAKAASSRVSVRAAEEGAEAIAVAEAPKSEMLPYMENIPRAIVEKEALEGVLAMTPREQWEDPPEDSMLYTLKVYAETYGEGRATKMPWWDWLYMRFELPDVNEVSPQVVKEMQEEEKVMRGIMEGKFPIYLPIFGIPVNTGRILDWKPEQELWAGDQIRSPVSDGAIAKNFMSRTAFYREGLKPWQRGIEIGMAHGYFLVGPFAALGPLRATPEAATVGLLSAAAVVGIVSVGGLLFGATVKPRAFDEEGAPAGSGFTEIINWHAVGGLGGAGFAHWLLTVFAS